MIPRMYVGMGLALVTLGVVGVVLVQNRENATAAAGGGGLLFPGFESTINEVAAVTIESADGAFTVTRDADGGWGMVEKGGYPADVSKVRKLLFALKDARAIEEKTSDPARYDKLGVEGVAAPESKSSEITVTDASGRELAVLVLGKLRPAQGGSRTSTYYVRKPGEAAAWLAEGNLTVDKTQKGWLEKDIVDLDRERVRAVRITHLDGEVVYVRKPDETATDFEIVEMPEGKVPTYASVANSLSSGLARLTMDDVVPASEHEFGNPPEAVCTFWTFDGLKITVTSEQKDDTFYVRVEAAYDESGPPGAPALTPPEPDGDDGDEGDEAAEPEDDGFSPDEVKAEVAELNAKLGGWVYVLPSWKKSTFMKRLDEMVKDAPEPEPEDEDEEAEVVPEISDPFPPPPPVDEIEGDAGGETDDGSGDDSGRDDSDDIGDHDGSGDHDGDDGDGDDGDDDDGDGDDGDDDDGGDDDGDDDDDDGGDGDDDDGGDGGDGDDDGDDGDDDGQNDGTDG